MNKNKYAGILIVLFFVFIINFMSVIVGTESSYMNALDKSYKNIDWILLHIIDDYNPKFKYALFITEDEQIRITSIYKNIFGWKVGVSTGGITSVNSMFDKRGVLGYSQLGTSLMFGVITDERIDKIKVNNTFAEIIDFETHKFRIWYITESAENHNKITAFSKTMQIIDKVEF